MLLPLGHDADTPAQRGLLVSNSGRAVGALCHSLLIEHVNRKALHAMQYTQHKHFILDMTWSKPDAHLACKGPSLPVVGTASDHADVAQLKLEDLLGLAALNVKHDGVIDLQSASAINSCCSAPETASNTKTVSLRG